MEPKGGLHGLGGLRFLILASILLTSKGTSAACTTYQFECDNGRCVPRSWVCDSEDDCGDASDEPATKCPERVTCGTKDFECEDASLCVPRHWTCDGENDCKDASDEDPKLCRTQKADACKEDEFRCKSGQCVDQTRTCDRHKDCDDASDEEGCTITCKEDEMTCTNGKCVKQLWRCDGLDDCGDASDELGCPANATSEHVCRETDDMFACTDGHCIRASWRCDGDLDCPDASDERDCELENKERSLRSHGDDSGNSTAAIKDSPLCAADEFSCATDSYDCVHKLWVCDGEVDCQNGADEAYCQAKATLCGPGERSCTSGECISIGLWCSGEADCPDASDELSCDTTAKKNDTNCDLETEFQCRSDSTCIEQANLCDGHVDCPDGSDEDAVHCHVHECQGAKVDKTLGVGGSCLAGFSLAENGTCLDIDECLIGGHCSQLCTNTLGSFACSCVNGYVLEDGTKCRASFRGPPSLIFAHKSHIRKISFSNGTTDGLPTMSVLANDTRSSCAVDYDSRTGYVFWSDVATANIYRSRLDNMTVHEVLIDHNVITADGLACDWIYAHVFWTDAATNSIRLSDFKGTMVATVIGHDLDEPRAIALHPEKGWLFWSDWGSHPRIERSAMNGEGRKTIIDKSVQWPNGIAIDLVADRIFWVDAKLNVISSANLDGSERRIVLQSHESVRHPFSITVFEDSIFWSDWNRRIVFRANKFSGCDVQALTSPLDEIPMTVHVFHGLRQPDSPNLCGTSNGGCSHFCLPRPESGKAVNLRTVVCLCPDGFELTAGNRTCRMTEAALSANIQGTSPSRSALSPASPRKKISLLTGRSAHPKSFTDGMTIGIIVACLILSLVPCVAFFVRTWKRHVWRSKLTADSRSRARSGSGRKASACHRRNNDDDDAADEEEPLSQISNRHLLLSIHSTTTTGKKSSLASCSTTQTSLRTPSEFSGSADDHLAPLPRNVTASTLLTQASSASFDSDRLRMTTSSDDSIV